MRLIGNKTRLLGSIEDFLRERGVVEGSFLDLFAGTASVARHFRRAGFQVRSNDLLASSFARQKVYVGLRRYPRFAGVRAIPSVQRVLSSRAGAALVEAVEVPRGASPGQVRGLREVLGFLHGLRGREGLIARQYGAGGVGERLYFSRENARAIDAIHTRLCTWRRQGALDDAEFYVLLASLLEAADRVANISGTYGAFLKSLQASAREPLRLRVPVLDTAHRAGKVYREDANRLVRKVAVNTLYIDPPYNHRQYAKNYHVLEVLAELHTVRDRRAYEAEIYGKTGLLPFSERLSQYCRRAGVGRESPCARAFADLVATARAEHIVVSYSEEGILSREELGGALARAVGAKRYDFARDHCEITTRRFRSDRDDSGRRQYRVVEGRGRDQVGEWLFYLHKPEYAGALSGR